MKRYLIMIRVPSAEEFSDSEDLLPKEITKWNSNDLMDKFEAADTEETPGMLKTLSEIMSGTVLDTGI